MIYSQLVPFQRPSRCLKSHGKGRTSFNRRAALRLILSSGAFALQEAFKVSQKPRQGQDKLKSKPMPFQRPSRCLKSHGKGRTSKNQSLCPFRGLQGVSKASARAKQAKIKACALSEAFKASQKPWQGQNKLQPHADRRLVLRLKTLTARQPQARPAVDQITLEINF